VPAAIEPVLQLKEVAPGEQLLPPGVEVATLGESRSSKSSTKEVVPAAVPVLLTVIV